MDNYQNYGPNYQMGDRYLLSVLVIVTSLFLAILLFGSSDASSHVDHSGGTQCLER